MHGLRKLARDFWLSRGRMLIMLLAMALGLAGFHAVIGALSVLTRELAKNYMESEPAAAILELDDVSPELLRRVSERPDVAGAVRRRRLIARFHTDTSSFHKRASVFVVDDFHDMPVAKLFPERGAWPPPLGTVLLERSALPVLDGDVGDSFFLSLPRGGTHRVEVSGVAHEPALAPANTEQAIIVYATPETLGSLGEPVTFDELRFTLREGNANRAMVEARAREIATWVSIQGLGDVTAIRVPPPGRHPHQTQMTTILVMFGVFSALVVILSCLLNASLISTMMARQVREIGIMKALGARTWQIALYYGVAVEVLALAALLLSWWPGGFGARTMSDAIAQLLNFDVSSHAQTEPVVHLRVGIALILPLFIALPSIWRGSRVSVQTAIFDYGVDTNGFGERRLETWFVRHLRMGRLLAYSVRSALRRRRRFLLAIALLASAGGIFVAALSVADSWGAVTQSLYSSRHYDLEIGFTRPVQELSLEAEVLALPAVQAVETWRSARTARVTADGIPIERTYPDGAHGAFELVAPPGGSRMFTVDVLSGRWLREVDEGAVVVNQMVPGAESIAVGDTLTLSLGGKMRNLAVVGKIREVGTGASAYVSRATFDAVTDTDHARQIMRVSSVSAGIDATSEAQEQLERVLREASVPVESITPLAVFENAVAAHFAVLVNTLLALAGLCALVGGLGLGSAVSANLVEGTRELGVLRALGATGGQVRHLVLAEGLFVSVVSFICALPLGIALAFAMGDVIGEMTFKFPLPLTPSLPGMLMTLTGFVAMSTLATWVPARRAARMTVQKALQAL